MRIAIVVEGQTEKAFKQYLVAYLQTQLAGKMPKLDFVPRDGRIPTGGKLKRIVENLLNDKKQPADAVIALTDVYTGSTPPEFPTAEDAKKRCGNGLVRSRDSIRTWRFTTSRRGCCRTGIRSRN